MNKIFGINDAHSVSVSGSLAVSIELMDPGNDEFKDPEFDKLIWEMRVIGTSRFAMMISILLERIARTKTDRRSVHCVRTMDMYKSFVFRQFYKPNCPFMHALMIVADDGNLASLYFHFKYAFTAIAEKIGWRESRLIALKYLRRLEESGELDAVQVAASFKDI